MGDKTMTLMKKLNVPVFYAEGIPKYDLDKWTVRVEGLVETPHIYTFAQVLGWQQSTVDARLTSVSGWSVRLPWQGTLWRDFLPIAKPLPTATHVTFVSMGGYESNCPLAKLDHPRVLLCHSIDGERLEREYGAPLRMIVPNLWGYKSVKGLARIIFVSHEEGGFWEDRGYTRNAEIEPGITLDINTGKRRPIQGGEVIEF
jgi:DMSO/TMAO reductase YedYZ molybdopterin-dependent catalytic subunit